VEGDAYYEEEFFRMAKASILLVSGTSFWSQFCFKYADLVMEDAAATNEMAIARKTYEVHGTSRCVCLVSSCLIAE
jgi:hypothetical protein